eukprot:CAMPEP_0194291222 /NCGR_PEP_ID=MMETSP0169-20130528/43015_1 /TAXON_ID=218684 /ORGANISM="Corethron pennatum, Strain L29A3" /LENGTH=170 /DNA_ID=CAMNT_0039039043 /DNA_START=156 /DNA_END=668 /DNA_ORIENTATION=+
MDSSLDLHAPIAVLICLWVLDLAHFTYDQHQKIHAFSKEIERADADGSGSTPVILRALAGEMFGAVSLSLKIISILFFAVVYRSVDDANLVRVLQQYSGRLATTSNFFAGVTAVSLAFLLVIGAYGYCCHSSRTAAEATKDGARGELAVPLLREDGDDISRGVAVAAIGV